MQRPRSWLVLVLAFALVPASLFAQDRANVSGTVTAGTSGQLLSGAQVAIAATNSRAVTDENGRFTLVNVPFGTHAVRVTRLGFRPVSREVTVGTGGASSTSCGNRSVGTSSSWPSLVGKGT